jgi:tRNA A58 N-methylase Trm61
LYFKEKIIMPKLESDFNFKVMSFIFRLRDLFIPPKDLLREVGIKTGFRVLDYGCGPGSYILPLAKLLGNSGKIYALDIHPSAISSVKNIIRKIGTYFLCNRLCKVIKRDKRTGYSSQLDRAKIYG